VCFRSAESWSLSHRRNVFRSHSYAQYIRGKLWSALRVLARGPSSAGLTVTFSGESGSALEEPRQSLLDRSLRTGAPGCCCIRPGYRPRRRVLRSYDRSVQLGAIPVDLASPAPAPATSVRPPAYQRGYSEEPQSLLLSLLASGRSLNTVKEGLQKMGLSRCQQELERVATGLIEELELRNSRPLDPDLLALFLDGKYVEFRDGDLLLPACIYVVVDLRRDARKQVFAGDKPNAPEPAKGVVETNGVVEPRSPLQVPQVTSPGPPSDPMPVCSTPPAPKFAPPSFRLRC